MREDERGPGRARARSLGFHLSETVARRSESREGPDPFTFWQDHSA